MKWLSPICFIFLIIQVSCIEDLEMKTYEHSDKIVINSLFSPDSNFYVRISKNTGIDSAIYNNNAMLIDTIPSWEQWYNNAVAVNEPKVELFKNNVFIEELLSSGRGVFRSINEIPQPGVNYEIKVSADGMKSVTAKDIIPDKVSIRSVNYEDVGKVFNNDDYFTKVNITFTDPVDKINYYEILFPSPIWYSLDEGGRAILASESYGVLFTDDQLILAEGDQDSYCSSFIFSDKLINGQTYNLTVYLSGLFKLCDLCEEFVFHVELRSISYEYYQYRKKMRKYLNYKFSGTDLQQIYSVGEPVIMYTNVENGYGVFVGYSADTVTATQANKR